MAAHSDDLPTPGTRHTGRDGTIREVVAVDPKGQHVDVRYHWPDGRVTRGRLGYWPGTGWVSPPR